MPITIDEAFEAAANRTIEWRKVLISTQMLLVGKEGYVVCKPPQEVFNYESYKYNLEVLLKYPNNDPYYVMVVDALKKYVEEWEHRT
ncbi:MAG: hypothetical protein OQK82_02825 [Candidatus Pacearchaeota archaeon]|nr:hypothetical protein [Candidatus Pacearchaeota archaeon]